MIYSPGNSAKQWILTDIEQRFSDQPVRILDLACGRAWIWEKFLPAHQNVSVVGVDTDAEAILEGKKRYEGISAIDLYVLDAQGVGKNSNPKSQIPNSSFDVVVALSAIEHVVDREAFLKTAWDALKPGGMAYLNYDIGHFRSRNLKERIMVPVSQLMALVGVERYYMKRVNDADFLKLAEKQGFHHVLTRKHNLPALKGFMKSASVEAIEAWIAFEERLGSLYTSEELDRIMWSTTLVLKKP